MADVCPNHNNTYTAYCQQHNTSLCIDCLLGDHRECIEETINLSNAMEDAMATTEEYTIKMYMLAAELKSKLTEKKQLLTNLERLNSTLKDGILRIRCQLIEKINIMSGDALELVTSVVTEQQLLVEGDVRTLDKLMSDVNKLGKSVDRSLNSRLSKTMEILGNTHVDILQMENALGHINPNSGNVKVQFLVNPRVTDVLENFNSLGEIRVENMLKPGRGSKCLYLSPMETGQMPVRQSITSSYDKLNTEEIFEYQENAPMRRNRDTYINIDDALFTDYGTVDNLCKPPPSDTIPDDPDILPFSVKLSDMPRDEYTDYAPSMFYENSTIDNKLLGQTSRTQSLISNTDSINDDSGVVVDTSAVKMRPKPKPRRRTSDDANMSSKRPVPRLPRTKTSTTLSEISDTHSESGNRVHNLASSPSGSLVMEQAPIQHLFNGQKPRISADINTDSGVIVELPENIVTSANSSPVFRRRQAPQRNPQGNFHIQTVQARNSDRVVHQPTVVARNEPICSSFTDIRHGYHLGDDKPPLSLCRDTSFTNGVNETADLSTTTDDNPRKPGNDSKPNDQRHFDESVSDDETSVKQIERTGVMRRLCKGIDSDVRHRHVSEPVPATKAESECGTLVKSHRRSTDSQGFRVPSDSLMGGVCLVTGIAMTANGEVVICLCHQHKLQLYDGGGVLQHVYSLAKPYGACSIPGNKIAVTSRDRNSICIFSVVENQLKCIQEEKICDNRGLYGISFSNGVFCVSCLDKLLVLTEALQIKLTIKGSSATGGLRLRHRQQKDRAIFSDVHYSAIDGSAESLLIYSSDYRRERVYCMDSSGRVKWDRFVSCPTSVQLHRERVFVASYRQIVVLCPTTGRCIREIKEGVPKRPWALVVDTMTKGLLVSNRSKLTERAKQISHVSLHSPITRKDNEYVFNL